MTRRTGFYEIFEVKDGRISPKVVVQIGGVRMSPGVSFSGGVSFGGVDLSRYMGKDLEVEEVEGVHKILGVYQ